MADLHTLYQESGLQGILPYAFGMTGQGYQFLCDKMKEGISFWIIVSDSNQMPFVFAENERTYFSLYSDEEMANHRCDELAMSKFYTRVVQLDSAGWTDRLWRRYRDLGATHMLFNDSIWVDIRDLAPIATYDGMLNSTTPLRNAQLNAALYCIEQYLLAGVCPDSLKAYFWRVFKSSIFYVPVKPIQQLSSGQTLTPENAQTHIITFDDGQRAFLGFTDGEFLNIYAETNGLSPEEYTAAYTPTYQDIRDYMNQNPDLGFLINSEAGDFLFTWDVFEDFELASLNHAALEASEQRSKDD